MWDVDNGVFVYTPRVTAGILYNNKIITDSNYKVIAVVGADSTYNNYDGPTSGLDDRLFEASPGSIRYTQLYYEKTIKKLSNELLPLGTLSYSISDVTTGTESHPIEYFHEQWFKKVNEDFLTIDRISVMAGESRSLSLSSNSCAEIAHNYVAYTSASIESNCRSIRSYATGSVAEFSTSTIEGHDMSGSYTLSYFE